MLLKLSLDYEAKLRTAGLELAEPFKGTSSKHHDIKCISCDNIFNATPKSKVQNFKKSGTRGCPKCTMDSRFETEKNSIRVKLEELGFDVLTPFRGKLDDVTVKNRNCVCGRPWKTKPTYLLTGRSFCRPCNDDRKRKRFDALNNARYVSALNTKSDYLRYLFRVRRLTRAVYNEHKSIINPDNKPRVKSGAGAGYQLDHIISVKQCYENDVPVEICASIDNLQIISRIDNAIKYSKPNAAIPVALRPYMNSTVVLDDMSSSIISNLKGVEVKLDHDIENFNIHIFLPTLKVAILLITFNAYKEQSIKSKYEMRNIRNKLADNGIRCFFIFESEWSTSRDIVISRLKHLAKLNTNNTIYARKLVVKEISKKAKSDFLKMNHLQGNSTSHVNLGGFYLGELVSVMTFSKPRMAMGRKTGKDGEYELARFASKVGHNVVGAASKLLSYFRHNYKWNEIYSYADMRWSVGLLYATMGFTGDKATPPNYWYIIDGKLKHRFGYRKDVVMKKFANTQNISNMTEYEIMLSNGYDRIWDCGSYKFTLLNETSDNMRPS